MDAQIDRLIDGYITHVCEQSPVTATSLGIDGYDDKLGDLSADAFARREEATDEWVRKFSAIGDEGLSLDQQIDRDLILSSLKGLQIVRPAQAWKGDPSIYIGPGLQGVFSLFLNRVHPDADLTRFAAERMRAVPEAIDNARKNLDPKFASRVIVERAFGMCRAGVTYFRDLVPDEVSDAEQKQTLAEAGEAAARAYEAFASDLEKLKADASGDWAIGEEMYSALLQEKEVLGYGAPEMLERGQAAYEDLSNEMSAFANQHFGTRDWVSVMKDLHKDHPETPDALRDEYDAWTERARQFLKDHDLVTFPEGEECRVVPSPHFQRPILAVASYSRPPAFKESRVGHFFVPFPPEGTSPEEVKKRLESNARSEIPTTSVHEAYPGHHWHITKMKDNPRKIRRVINTSFFTEGWALYTEAMMREQGFFPEPAHELAHLEARIFRAARIVVDTSLHMGKMTIEEAERFMQQKATLSEPTARAEVGRYCAWPTQAPSYLTGCLEIERMRKWWFAQGRDLKSFHDTIATSGGLPIGLAERALMGAA